ncbi:MAG: ADP-ribosylglycohydrolase family protein [Candidatus Limiplasma sp.]|nr:ADP-ribosylglycohydrolase family protein [Clostridiales bacterium]MDY4063481.1 ADP-ribosylglycohydrolase family protein [Candidatus Limiplasma sp.]
MKLEYPVYRDKVMGCWAGKNVGGVLGAPFECKRQFNGDVDFYTQDLSKGPVPNDDLDLQIVWLAAVERYGRNVNASILGEYWLSFVTPNWVEYGTGKSNLRAGLLPPLSGHVDNVYRNSCGCFIRSEIWACLAPGQPQLAAQYAREDAIVDHSEEGMYAEIFTAALQSAAFVESDPNTLIDIALSYVPADSALARAIAEARRCYQNQVDFREARKRVHNTAPGTFGLQEWTLDEIPVKDNEGMELGTPGFDAPENVAFSMLAWLYGEGDFGRSLCLANACGEDTDCTCATLGATLGIIMGAKNLPEKWLAPLDDKIATLCINRTSEGVWVPATVTELTDRVVRQAPLFVGQQLCDIYAPGGVVFECRSGRGLYCPQSARYLKGLNGHKKDIDLTPAEVAALTPYHVRYAYPAFSMDVDYRGSVTFTPGIERRITVTLVNSFTQYQQQWARVTLYTPPCAAVSSPRTVMLPLNNHVGAKAECTFAFTADETAPAKLELLVDVALEGRHSNGIAKVTLMAAEAEAGF